jgi:transposase
VAQRLVANGEVVLDVPAKLAARVRVFSQGRGRKTDRDDAVSIGLAALDGAGAQAVQVDGAMVSLRLWCDRRDELVASRTQAICRLHRLLTELTPGGSGRELSATMAAAKLKQVRPKDDVSRERKALALQHLGDVRSLDRRIKAARDRIAAMVDASGTGLVNLYGVGPLVAGRVLAEVGDVGRFPTKHHFATYNGTVPIDVSSGEQVRHRLSRAGNRRVNHAVHIMAVVQIRNPKSEGRAYYERKRTEGKTAKEALRCLKRRLSDVIYRQLVADHYARLVPCASPMTDRPTPFISTSPNKSSRVATPRPKPARHPASKPGSPSIGRRTASSASRSSTPTSSSRQSSSSRPKTLRKRVISTSP